MKKTIILFLALSMANCCLAQAERVLFSSDGGFYENSFQLSLYCFYADHHIRYTTNGNTPTSNSALYTHPLTLDESLYSNSDIFTIQTTIDELFFVPNSVRKCITIRACVFDEEGNRISAVNTQSYFISALGCNTHGLPVMSIAADSTSLFDYNTGILVPGVHFDPNNSNWTGNYYMRGREWEREVNVEFYEPHDNSGVNQVAGLRTHGGTARRGPQKGLKLYAREEYGTKRFYHKFFDDVQKNSFKHLVLKPFSCQYFSTGIQDEICNKMAKEIGLEYISSRPQVLFINGEYWGIYYLSECPDSHYLEDHFGQDDKDFNVIRNWYGTAEDGDSTNFIQMMQWLEDADLSNTGNYAHLCSLIDIDDFIKYYCLELFIANNDWPANNMRCYQLNNGTWRWIFFDGDDCLRKMDFDVFANATCEQNLGWPTDSRSTLMFRRLLENDDFNTAFFDQFEHLFAGAFNYESTQPFFEEASVKVRNEVSQQAERFNKPHDLASWENNISKINVFLNDRVDNMRSRIYDFLDVAYYETITPHVFPNPTHGTIYITIPENQLDTDRILIFNILGVLVYDNPVTTSLDLDLPHGVYIIKIGNHTQRIIIQ